MKKIFLFVLLSFAFNTNVFGVDCSSTIPYCASGSWCNTWIDVDVTPNVTYSACTACSSGYDKSDSDATSEGGCYKDCTLNCTKQACSPTTECTHGNETAIGKEYYGNTTCQGTKPTCTIARECKEGYYSNQANPTSCTQCTNAKPVGASYIGNSTTNNCPWNVTIQAGEYYHFADKSIQPCPTGKYCTGGTIVSNNTDADIGITGDCNKPIDASFTVGNTGASNPDGCPWNTVCASTKYWNSTDKQCKPCKAGYYCGGITGISNSTTTDIGLSPCGIGKTSAIGSGNAGACNYTPGDTGTKFCDKNNNCFYLP